MEVDSALAAVLALSLWSSGLVGVDISLWDDTSLSFCLRFEHICVDDISIAIQPCSRGVISVIQMASLIGLHAPFLPKVLITPQ
jgi:hypothetical protein